VSIDVCACGHFADQSKDQVMQKLVCSESSTGRNEHAASQMHEDNEEEQGNVKRVNEEGGHDGDDASH
jgi:hypothetical protein